VCVCKRIGEDYAIIVTLPKSAAFHFHSDKLKRDVDINNNDITPITFLEWFKTWVI